MRFTHAPPGRHRLMSISVLMLSFALVGVTAAAATPAPVPVTPEVQAYTVDPPTAPMVLPGAYTVENLIVGLNTHVFVDPFVTTSGGATAGVDRPAPASRDTEYANLYMIPSRRPSVELAATSNSDLRDYILIITSGAMRGRKEVGPSGRLEPVLAPAASGVRLTQ